MKLRGLSFFRTSEARETEAFWLREPGGPRGLEAARAWRPRRPGRREGLGGARAWSREGCPTWPRGSRRVVPVVTGLARGKPSSADFCRYLAGDPCEVQARDSRKTLRGEVQEALRPRCLASAAGPVQEELEKMGLDSDDLCPPFH